MQAYREESPSLLKNNKLRLFKNKVDEPCFMVENHWHDSYEILFVREGYGEQHINAQKFAFSKSAVIVISPGDIHSTVAISKRGCDIDVLQFIPEYFGAKEDLLSNLTSSIIESADGEIYDLIEKIKKSPDSDKADDDLIVSGAMFMLCGLLIRSCKNSGSSVKMSLFIRNVCHYLRNTDDIRLTPVSRHFGYSPEHFSRKFHAESGISYKHYCEKIRMKQFLEALDEDCVSLSQMAEQLEYSDTSSFVRAFKRIYGITPGAYRKLKKQV